MEVESITCEVLHGSKYPKGPAKKPHIQAEATKEMDERLNPGSVNPSVVHSHPDSVDPSVAQLLFGAKSGNDLDPEEYATRLEAFLLSWEAGCVVDESLPP